jgi:DNA-binding FadR family transcriptional regulator
MSERKRAIQRLTNAHRIQIQREYRTPCTECGHLPTQPELAKKLGLSRTTIHRALRGDERARNPGGKG